MIEYIIGKISYKNNNYLILENNFKGYKLFMSDPNIFEENSSAKIFVYTKIFQNNKNNFLFEYYGFKTLREKIFFENLLTVNGIGPKTSLTILRNDLNLLKELIRNEDIESLSVLEGFTNKTALSIVSALSYKLKNERISEYNNDVNHSSINQQSNSYNPVPDLVSALKALGYKKNMIEKAINLLIPQLSNVSEDQISDLISQAIKIISDEAVTNKTTVS
ncbi:holliday junction DNA helicase [Malacoplasma penetrans HF-2]|uniref:Holliday junction branch migration complex subunit RuvA n=1 Tax=Malacoplasma penetrans (strain HF-2) TaxID=272633 RepID=RUVA_MALP2|nr:Holliday junction branch migration protein RuvA [Malacoplasma penetrans]Q8EWC5.1 RecName: Full=Holliday junction branch migration complex subunit RuvA [Malacoplasma penetrans HF-2]BAC44071.1 holliday junction DNA helicase [Malacoplasma penetrans HF-2]